MAQNRDGISEAGCGMATGTSRECTLEPDDLVERLLLLLGVVPQVPSSCAHGVADESGAGNRRDR